MGEKRKKVALWIVIAGEILLLILALARVYSNSERSGVITLLPGPPAQVMPISPAKARAAYDNGSAVFMDVRGSESYAQSHIPGALLIPLSELGNRLDDLDKSSWIITYCD